MQYYSFTNKNTHEGTKSSDFDVREIEIGIFSFTLQAAK